MLSVWLSGIKNIVKKSKNSVDIVQEMLILC